MDIKTRSDSLGGGVAPPSDRTLHGLVLEAAACWPEKVAVEVEEGGGLTYAQLDERSLRLAQRLRAEGIGPGSLVAACLERSLDLAVGLLGVLRAGAAYVPLDPGYPSRRIELMLEDSGAAAVLAHAETAGALPDVTPTVIRLDMPDPGRSPSAEPAGAEAGPEELAYVIYTSGSTGRPKGVMVPHRALCNFMWSMRGTPGFSEHDTLVSVTTPSFDIFGLELFLPLVSGGRVVLATRPTAADGAGLAALVEASGATVMQATPATWRLLVDAGWTGRRRLRALCGGEALSPGLAAELLERCGELWNMFGPTETTIWSTCIRLEQAEPPIPIGLPIANTDVHVIGDDGTPLPPGEVGELYIGGEGLAHGYLRRPELTAERFVEHEGLNRRLYRTGDLVRRRPDGVLDYLGRLDHQVKVRGFRIELGEIEVTLERLAEVAQAVVVAHASPNGREPELVAYVVAADGFAVDAPALRRALLDVLPDHMVPSHVIGLEQMPLTPNGKVDRNALPAPSRKRVDDGTRAAPRTPLESRLTEIWEDTLDLRPIGVSENFFDLGVSSLTAARLFARIEHELGRRLPLGAVFRAPTIEALARLVEADDGSRFTSLVPIQPHGSLPPIFCVHGGAGTVLLLEPLARGLGEEQPFYGLQSRGLYGRVPPLKTVEEMAAHYLAEIRSVQPSGPYHLAGYCFGAMVAFEMAMTLSQAGEKVAMLAVLSGPSSTWIREWGWRGNQPHLREIFAQRRAEWQDSAGPVARAGRVMRDPRKLLGPVKRRALRLAVRRALATNRPIPEEARERFFLGLHSRAERSYRERYYPGEIVAVSGEGLYADSTLGWAPFAASVVTHTVPGDHLDNRELLKEPHVSVLRDRIEEYLAERRSTGVSTPRPDRPSSEMDPGLG